jgi:hypothetical protein
MLIVRKARGVLPKTMCRVAIARPMNTEAKPAIQILLAGHVDQGKVSGRDHVLEL